MKASIIDSWFDNYVGIVILVRVIDGCLKPKDKIRFMNNKAVFLCEQVRVFTLKSVQKPLLSADQVEFVITGIKKLQYAKVGDRITLDSNPATEQLPGFKETLEVRYIFAVATLLVYRILSAGNRLQYKDLIGCIPTVLPVVMLRPIKMVGYMTVTITI